MTSKTIDKITEIRASNNQLWMTLLKIALEHAPDEAKAVLAKINENDGKISLLLSGLAE
jgi:hypothetical protein